MSSDLTCEEAWAIQCAYHPNGAPPTADPRDLETIVSLMELAAISLTTMTNTTFTKDELFREAQAYGGAEVPLHRVDFDIVLSHAKFIRPVRGRRLRLR